MPASAKTPSGFLAHVWQMASGIALGQVWLVLATPVLSRLYSPADFGLFGVFSAFVAFASVAATLRLEMGLPSAPNESAEVELLITILVLVVPVSLALGLLLWPLSRAGILDLGSMPVAAAWLAGVAVLAVGLANTLRYAQTRRRNFSAVGRAMSRQGLARGVAPILLAPLGWGWAGLVIGDTVGRLLGIRPMLAGVSATLLSRLRTYRISDGARVLSAHRNYLRILLPSSLLDAAAAALPLPLIARLFGIEAAGEYALVTRIAAAPGALIGNSIADVFHGHFVLWRKQENCTALREFYRTTKRLCLAALAVYLPAALLAPAVFQYVFGTHWEQAGCVLTAMTPFLAAGLIVSPLSRVLIVTDRMHHKLLIDALFLTVPCGVLWMASDQGYLTALALFAIAGAVIFFVYWQVIGRAVRTSAGSQ